MSHARRVMRELGYVDFHDGLLPIETNSHQCGTLRFGRDPQHSVLDPLCRSWQHDNLYVVDASFFPSSAALNPALTIAAQALRVGQYLRGAHG
jgi:choline dehydrogenase-like flavoprotein